MWEQSRAASVIEILEWGCQRLNPGLTGMMRAARADSHWWNPHRTGISHSTRLALSLSLTHSLRLGQPHPHTHSRAHSTGSARRIAHTDHNGERKKRGGDGGASFAESALQLTYYHPPVWVWESEWMGENSYILLHTSTVSMVEKSLSISHRGKVYNRESMGQVLLVGVFFIFLGGLGGTVLFMCDWVWPPHLPHPSGRTGRPPGLPSEHKPVRETHWLYTWDVTVGIPKVIQHYTPLKGRDSLTMA